MESKGLMEQSDPASGTINEHLFINSSTNRKSHSFRHSEGKIRLLKIVSLVTLTLQNAVLGISMRYARTRSGDMFLSTTAVMMAEFVKLLTSLALVYHEEGSFNNWLNVLHSTIIKQPLDTLKVGVPSFVYIVQNNLLYLSASHLDAATYQVTYQLKILTTAMFAVTMLRRVLSIHQWSALVLLAMGVAMVQLTGTSDKVSTTGEQNRLIGFAAAIAACVLSGFAGIYFEMILKGSDISVWMRNVQLSFLSLPFGIITCFVTDWESIQSKGFFFGYDAFIIYLIVLQAGGGLMVAMVVKYADNILKGFATSLAIIIACIFSIYFFEFKVTSQFVFGSSMVIASVFLYNHKPKMTVMKNKLFLVGFGIAVMLWHITISTELRGDVIDSHVIHETSLSLRDILPLNPKHYDKNRAPKLQGQPTIVYFHVTVLSLDSINEESMTYVADIFLAQSWRDPRLRLPENMSEEYRILDVGWLHDIWRPDCFFKNAKKVTFHEMSIPNHYLWLYHDKTLLYMSKLTLVLSCAMKFESYPHDTQNCSMMIESLSHTTHDLVFIWNMTDPLVVNPEIELPQLDISNNYTADCTIEYSTGNFTCLAVVFNLRRRLGYHLFHTYIPSALIVVMSWISFWIKPEAIPARVTLGVTSLLTLATQNTQSQQSLPPVSYVKAIDIWMSSCSVFVFLSLMEFAVVNNYMGPIATKAMKGYSEEDIRSAIDDLKELDPSSQRVSLPPIPQYPTFCNGREIALSIDQFSRLFFPFCFLLLNVIYWTAFL